MWVSAAPTDNTQLGPIVFRAAIYHAIDGDVLGAIVWKGDAGMDAPTPILMDIDQHAALPFPHSLPEFQRLFPDVAACAEYLEKAPAKAEAFTTRFWSPAPLRCRIGSLVPDAPNM